MTILHLYAVAATVISIITCSFLVLGTYNNLKEAAMYRDALQLTHDIKRATSPEQVRAIGNNLVKFYLKYVSVCDKAIVDFHYNSLTDQCAMKHRALSAERAMYKGRVAARDRDIWKNMNLAENYGAGASTIINTLTDQNGKS